jgi:hypothetical protein
MSKVVALVLLLASIASAAYWVLELPNGRWMGPYQYWGQCEDAKSSLPMQIRINSRCVME